MTIPVGAYKGNGIDGVSAMNAEWLPFMGVAGSTQIMVDFLAFDSWASMGSDANWAIPAWKGKIRNLCLSVPLTVNGVPLSDVVNGAGDATFRAVANTLLSAGFPNALIRLGWEANGGWYPWGDLGTDSAKWAAYKAAWRRVVGIFRSVSSTFQFVWNMAQGWQQTGDKSVLYPGDGYVTFVALDLYGQKWGTNNPTTQQCWDAWHQGWTLDWLPGFAAAHNKAMCFPEVGIGGNIPGQYGPGDDGALATELFNWINSQHVSFVGWWDWDGTGSGDYASKISTGERPNVAAAWKAAF